MECSHDEGNNSEMNATMQTNDTDDVKDEEADS